MIMKTLWLYEWGFGLADDIPAEGWPDDFKADVVERILGYLPSDETEI